jgi:hypothetical protein
MRTRFWVAVVLPVLTVSLAACGAEQGSDLPTANGGSSTSTSATARSDADREEQAREFAQCMRDNGVEVADPKPGKPAPIGGPEGAEDAETKAALEACREFMPSGGDRPETSPEQLEQQRAHARCMREHGVTDFPDPDPDAEGGQASNLDPDDPTLKAAEEACRDQQPDQGGPSGSTEPSR